MCGYVVPISPLHPGKDEAQLRAQGEAALCMCSLQTEGVLLGCMASVLEITPGAG